MRLQVTYWKAEENEITTDVDVEFDVTEDVEILPCGEDYHYRKTSEYEVFIYGDIPEEIKDSIKCNFNEDKKFYHGVTPNYEFEAE